MAKTPQKPETAKKKPPAEKPPQKVAGDPFAEHQADIETALKRCTAHLKKVKPEVAEEIIKRLPAYYRKMRGNSVPSSSKAWRMG